MREAVGFFLALGGSGSRLGGGDVRPRNVRVRFVHRGRKRCARNRFSPALVRLSLFRRLRGEGGLTDPYFLRASVVCAAQDCTVGGLAAPVDGTLDAACVDGVTLADAASCSLACNAGFYVGGAQPSCAAGTFDVGSVSCTACAEQTGCEAHTAGSCTGQQLDCATAAAGYSLAGTVATANVCVAPTTAVEGVETLPTCTGFTTGAVVCPTLHGCAEGYADVDEDDDDYTCDSAGAELSVTGCDPCTAQTGCATPGVACEDGTDKLECTALDAGYTTDASTSLVREIQCNVPSTAPAGYDVSTMACSSTGAITTLCETPATCAAGFSGTVITSCGVDGSDLTLSGCDADLVCVLATTPVTGYDLTGLACSALTSAGVACETPAVCGTGYSGTIAYTCDADGAELSVSGCIDADECDGTPCGLGATCTSSIAPLTDYTCSCGAGLSGGATTNEPATCSDTDGCAAVASCGANAACIDQAAPNDGYSCACISGYNGATTVAGTATCAANPTCSSLSSSMCTCQREENDPTQASLSCNGADSATVDVLDLTAVCATDTCDATDCCVDFQPCPANSQVSGYPLAGHGQLCVCNSGYSGNPTWDTATETYSGTCEPIACPDHPLYPAATGGQQLDGSGSTNCACPAGYSVKPHCQDTTQDTCAVTSDGDATDDDGCAAASAPSVDCTYTAPVAAGEPSCSVAAACTSAPPGQTNCEAVSNAAGQSGDCEFTAGSGSSCAPTATCPTTEVEADCVTTEATCDDGVSVTQDACDGNAGTWAAPCAFTTPSCSVDTPSCTGDADTIPATCGAGNDLDGLPCAVNADGDGCDAITGDCAFAPASTPACDLTAECPVGCDPTPAAITSELDCTAAGGSWSIGSCGAIAEASCGATLKQNDETQCIDTTLLDMSGVCSFTAMMAEACSVKTDVAQTCSQDFVDGGSDESSCDVANCVYDEPAEPVAEACELSLDRNTKGLCELTAAGELTGLIWDGGTCYRQLPGLVTEDACTLMASGGVYSPAQDPVAATCVDVSGGLVTAADQVACEGDATGYSWVLAACSDSTRDVNTCLVTGNTWRAAVAEACVNGVGNAQDATTETECLFESDGTTPTAFTWRVALLDVCTTPAARDACTETWTTDASDQVVLQGVASDTGTPFAGCAVAAADQAACESLASVNTWTEDACMDDDTAIPDATGRQECEGTTTNTWTPAVPEAPHSCTDNGLWNANTDNQADCELVQSGNTWTTSTAIEFVSADNYYSGFCTPKICPTVTVASGSISSSSEVFYTGNGVDVICDTGFEPVGDFYSSPSADSCTGNGFTWKEAKCSAWSSGQCTAWTTASCVPTHLTCETDASYDFATPTCQPKQCGSVDTSQGTVSGGADGYTFSATGSGGLTVVCEEGYEVVTEQKTGSCSDPSKTTKTACENVVSSCSDVLLTTAETCVDPAVWTEGGVWTIAAASATRGYGTCSDPALATKTDCAAPAAWDEKTEQFDCPASGSWDAGVPMCKPRRCPSYCNTAECSDDQNDLDPGPEPRLLNGAITGSRTYRPGSSDPDWTFTCNDGYTLTGATEASCQVNGEWTVQPPVCVLITWCELPPNFERDVFVSDAGETLGTRVLNIDDCWFPDQRIFGRNSESGIDGVMDVDDPAKTDSCEVRCFPTCDEATGTDAEGKPCVDGRGITSSTFKCGDGGFWEGTKPLCQRAPVSQSGVSSPRPSALLLLLLPAALTAVLQW